MRLKDLPKTRLFRRLCGYVHNWRECLVGAWHWLRFWQAPVAPNTVLLAEPNAFHGEILPGFVEYFQELGFHVTVLTRYAIWSNSPFNRLSSKPRHYCLTIAGMRSILRSRKVHDFEYVLLTSARSYLNERCFIHRYLDFLKATPSGKRGYGLIEHSLAHVDYGTFWDDIPNDAPAAIQLREHTFLLTATSWRGHEIPMLNPHRFGAIHRPAPGKRKVLVTVGRLNSKTRDVKTLLDALMEIGRSDEFELWIVGRMKTYQTQVWPSNVHATGYLTFDQMYAVLEKADFLLALLDPQTQSSYLDGCTSGSRQLALGFGIIPVIHRAFAQPYGFTEQNAILHEDNGLAKAIQTALDLSPEDTAQKRAALSAEAQRVHDVSLSNLKQRLHL